MLLSCHEPYRGNASSNRMRFLLVFAWITGAVLTTTMAKNQTAGNNLASADSSAIQAVEAEKASLQTEIKRKQDSQDRFNKWNMRCAIGAVVFGGLLGILSWLFQKLGSDAAYKTRPLVSQAEGIDSRIQLLRGTESAEKIEALRAESRHNESIANQARERSEETARQNLNLKSHIGELESENLARQQDLEKERIKRYELGASLKDRVFTDQFGAIAALSKYPRTRARFEYLGEAEVLSVAEQINCVLTSSGWITGRSQTTSSFIGEGVKISVGMGGPNAALGEQDATTVFSRMQLERTARSVADLLVALFNSHGLDASTAAPTNDPPGVIVITVGSKTNPVLDAIHQEVGSAAGNRTVIQPWIIPGQ
ncbi:MAG TPA: hypothetical protein VH325_01225 [Bryobacteraceae bacterium]|jgi:hypothetical protein|nr:hypothetical protein [Bryobacteraceae bacterium]